MFNNIATRRAAIVAAVGAAFAAGSGAASAGTIYGAGASAVQNSIRYLILKDYCSSSIANYYDSTGSAAIAQGGTPGGKTFRIQCSPASGTGLTTVDISYDTQGGSWKAFTAIDPVLYTTAGSQNSALNANPVATSDTSVGCVEQASQTIVILNHTFTVNYFHGCQLDNLNPATQPVSFGLTDVEEALFNSTNSNQPLVNNSWTTSAGDFIFPHSDFSSGELSEYGGGEVTAFGVVFGIGASKNLYAALVKDQIAAGILATSCPSVAPAGVLTAAQELCAPTITRAQYASIVSQAGSSLETSLAALFTTTAAPTSASFELARRDQGSGTQASSNAYFLNDGCANASSETVSRSAIPADHTNISYNSTTGGVQGKLETPTLDGGTGFAIGVLSVENESGFSAGAGFLRLNGVYPSVANASNGSYTYVSEENLHFNPNVDGDGAQFYNDLATTNNSNFPNESAFQYGVTPPQNGIVPAPEVYASATWHNAANLCAGWQAY
jgi:hypothetical protein